MEEIAKDYETDQASNKDFIQFFFVVIWKVNHDTLVPPQEC